MITDSLKEVALEKLVDGQMDKKQVEGKDIQVTLTSCLICVNYYVIHFVMLPFQR